MSDKHSVTNAASHGEAKKRHTGQESNQPRQRSSCLWTMVIFLFMSTILFNLWHIRKQLTQLNSQSQQQQFWLLCHGGAKKEERKNAFLGLLKSGNTEWQSANLKELDLSNSELPRIQVENANFENSNLSGANLAHSDLSFSQFQLVDFTDADLSSSNLIESYLLKAVLNNTNLTNTNLQRAMIEQVTGRKTKFDQADMSEAHMLLADLSEASFRGANMTLVNLEAATLQGCDLSGANLEGALLLDTDFTDSNWWRTLGLDSDAIEGLLRSFPPTAEIKPEWEEDFKEWLVDYMTKKEETPDKGPNP